MITPLLVWTIFCVGCGGVLFAAVLEDSTSRKGALVALGAFVAGSGILWSLGLGVVAFVRALLG